MSNKEIELILSRQFADCLSMAVFLVDPAGNLLFYNEPAEQILGLHYEETGFLPVEKWSTLFKPEDKDGRLLDAAELPLVQTLTTREPAHGSFWIHSLKGEHYEISVTSFPVMGRPDRFLGAIAIFWKKK